MYGGRICKACSKHRNQQGAERNILARLARGKCADCGYVFTRENIHHSSWDHRDPSEKTRNVSHMNKMTTAKFEEEIAKCDLVCLHDHATRTRNAILTGVLKVGRGHRRQVKSPSTTNGRTGGCIVGGDVGDLPRLDG